VLDAARVLFSTLRDRAQPRYDLLVSVVRSKAAAGTLSDQDIAGIDTRLEPQGSSR
jgi:outer membrane protein TolC